MHRRLQEEQEIVWMGGSRGEAGRAISASIFRRIKRARSGSGRWRAGTRVLRILFSYLFGAIQTLKLVPSAENTKEMKQLRTHKI